MKKKNIEGAKVETVIGTGSTVIGNIGSEKDLRIDGEIEGNIMANHLVIIGEKARIKGDIEGKNIIVYGKVNGNIKALGELRIMESGKLIGDVNAKTLYIAIGGQFNGKSIMEAQQESNKNEKNNTKK